MPRPKRQAQEPSVPEIVYRPNLRGVLVPVGKNQIQATPAMFQTAIATALHQPSDVIEGGTRMDEIAIVLTEKATAGDLAAVSEILDRVLGKAKQTTENLNVTTTFGDWLSALKAKKENSLGL